MTGGREAAMRDALPARMRQAREAVFALCAVWLVLQNLVLFAMFAWRPLATVLVATHVLVRVALHAAVPMTLLPGGGLLDVASAVLAAGLEVHHG
jgi:hypothetical protein